MLLIVTTVVVILLVYYFYKRESAGKGETGVIHIRGKIPWIGCGLDFVKDPKSFMGSCRKKFGDIFVLEMWGSKFFFVFTPGGMKKLYQIGEDEGSFPRATKKFLSLKVPPEISDLFEVMEPIWYKLLSQAFQRNLMGKYILNANAVINNIIDELPETGEFEITSFWRKFIHKFAFQCWCGQSTAEKYLQKFNDNFDKIDPELAFVKPISLIWTMLSGKKEEKRAVAEIYAVMTEILEERQKSGRNEEDLFSSLCETLPELLKIDDTESKKLACHVIIGFHLASQTNLSSAGSWLLVNLLTHHEHRNKIIEKNKELKGINPTAWVVSLEHLSEMEHLEKCIYETIRISQQSLTVRLMSKPVSFEQGSTVYTVPAGYYFSTLLNVLNCKAPAVPDKEYNPTEFCPERYKKDKIIDCPAGYEYVVSTFGHAKHACPGRQFSINTFKVVISTLFERLEMTPKFDEVKIPETQMGAVARLDRPCWVSFKKIY